MPPRSHSHRRSPATGQLLLFDLLDAINHPDAFAEPGTSLTPISAGDEPASHVHTRFDPGLWVAQPSPFNQPAPVEPVLTFTAPNLELNAPASELPADEVLPETQSSPSIDEEIDAIVSPPVLQTARIPQRAEPNGEDHVCTPADFVVGVVARFEANVAAIGVLKMLESEERAASPEERAVLARFSGFGDSAFEPAFRLIAHRVEEQAWVERGQRLRSLVDEAEWQSLERSRLNAFFTSPDVIEAIWEGLLALGLGNLPAPRILEPAGGIGRFLGLQPADIAVRSARTAVELDPLTARMLKALYPRTAVHPLGFQDAPLRDDAFDVAVSNVPFGDFPVVDRAYLKPGQRFLTRAIHNYFFVKALGKLRPGGVLAFITSRYTLDAPTAEPIRDHLYQQADVVAAVRLPAGTFSDTEVVTDLVILRKRLPGEVSGDDRWLKTVPQTYSYQRSRPANARFDPPCEEVRAELNAYFVAHPEMVLGLHGVTSQMYGGGGYSVALPEEGREAVIAALLDRMRALPAGLLAPAPPSAVPAPALVDGDLDLKEGAFAVLDDALRVRRGGRLVDPQISPPRQHGSARCSASATRHESRCAHSSTALLNPPSSTASGA